ncbi:TonB-dependent receptor domain-containing protein [Pseudomaricurvus sp. HS19]|uniref:TonB-dependent receptor domain-containing protein n=1 Tax=Pseudomaricurvus sp. HS19 TaxID=2692626 RepID=UPI0013701FD6|nr:TonB-dependent receptor [Pseudomaricurvus sp. HS19]MYM63164.1 TonB-dependent receptor [Pseudomaricurvus sp. HS19]
MKTRKNISRSTLAAAIATLTTATSALAAQPVDETMIVTANRMETPASKVLAPVSVMTAADISRLQITNVGELLSRMTSVETVSSGGPGTTTGIFVRGGNTDHTLVLVDGVRISSATNGNTAIELLDVNNIERVELVRGPASSLYGADAISGVINIITKQGQVSPLTLRTQIGSQDWSQTQLSSGGSVGATRWNLTAGYESLAGFDRHELLDNGNNDDDDYRNTHFAGSISHDWSEDFSTRLNYQQDDAETESDERFCANSSGVCLPYQSSRVAVLNLRADWRVMDKLALQAQASRARDWSASSDDAATAAERAANDAKFKTVRETYLLQANSDLSEQFSLVGGTEYYEDRIDTSSDYLGEERDNLAVFVTAQWSPGMHQLQVGARNDDNEAFGSHTTESVSWGYQLTDYTRVIASWGTAFRAPTFNDLYWPADPYGIGNPDLSPEESENAELALKWDRGAHSFSAAVFRNEVEGLVSWAPVDQNNYWGQWTPTNVDDALMEGFELSYGLQLERWSADANYSYVDAEDESTGESLPNRARRQFNLDVDYALESLSLGASVKARSARPTTSAALPELPGYGLLDLRARYQFTPALMMDATLSNVLDKEYRQRVGYNEEGRGFRVGLTYKL